MAEFWLCTCFGIAQQLWSVLGEDDHVTFMWVVQAIKCLVSQTHIKGIIPLFSWVNQELFY